MSAPRLSIYAQNVRRVSKRNFAAASGSRLFSDWGTGVTSANRELRSSIVALRTRSRQQERDNDYARRFRAACEDNILGADGIRLQMKIREPDGSYDRLANEMIERAWGKWGSLGGPTICEGYTWRDVEALALIRTIFDGGVLFRRFRGANAGSPFGYRLQLLEIDHIDHEYNLGDAGGGSTIQMGVQLDSRGRVQGYWIRPRHPGEEYSPIRNFDRQFINASEIIHLFRPERISQSLGAPWTSSAMTRLQMLYGYEEAELTAARLSACKGGYIEKQAGQAGEFVGDSVDEETGDKEMDMEPGVIRELDPGQKFTEADPTHPNQAYAEFTKGVLRGAASGLNISYYLLANDLNGVNYSSIRAGRLDDVERWKTIQRWLIDHFHEVIFSEWLEAALAFGQIKYNGTGKPLPMEKIEKFSQHEWKPRRWAWVDPEKEINAKVTSVANGFESRRSIIAEQGGDIEEVFNEQAEDQKLADEYGLKFGEKEEPKEAPKEDPEDEPVDKEE